MSTLPDLLPPNPGPDAPHDEGRPFPERGFTLLEGLTLCLLLALAGTVIIGYRFGDSNHGITVPILKRFIDPTLYPGDVMVATAERFPTIFYQALALLLPSTEWVAPAFFILYIASIAATLGAAYRIGCWAGGPAAGVLALLFAYPVRIGLAGEALYRVAFSHSHLASALALWAIVWFLEGRRMLPLLVLSIGAYNHLLYSAYVLVPLVLMVLVEAKEAGRRATLRRLAAAVLPLIPLAVSMMRHSSPMTPEWLELLRVRSSFHSFPGTFGPDLPVAAALLGLCALAASSAAPEKRRMLAVFLAGVALQFVVGTVFTEYWPAKSVLQYQPHRSWRFLLVLLYGFVASGSVRGYRAGGLARVVAIATAIVVFIPGFEVLLPLVMVASAALAGAPAWARLVPAAMLVLVSGWGERALALDFLTGLPAKLLAAPVLTASALAVVIAVARPWRAPVRRLAAGLAFGVTLLWFAPQCYGRLKVGWTQNKWRDVQDWVRTNTPRGAVVLTPAERDYAGFRVFSERTIVAEWKDGTQQYFDDAFAREWWARMEALDYRHFSERKDAEILGLAYQYKASYIVLPSRTSHPGLPPVYSNGAYTVYRARPR